MKNLIFMHCVMWYLQFNFKQNPKHLFCVDSLSNLVTKQHKHNQSEFELTHYKGIYGEEHSKANFSIKEFDPKIDFFDFS